jgi:hypothetical protein
LSAVGHFETDQDAGQIFFIHPRCGRFFAGGATVMPDAEMSALPAFPHHPAATDSESTTIMTACAISDMPDRSTDGNQNGRSAAARSPDSSLGDCFLRVVDWWQGNEDSSKCR